MFLEIKDATEVYDKLVKEFKEAYVKYYIQEDVWDFHVFRILEGDYDGDDSVYTVEMENIDKLDVVEKMGIELGDMDVREAFKYIDKLETLKAVIWCDVEKGYQNEEYRTEDTLDEAIDLVNDTQSEPEVILFEDTETDDQEEGDVLKLHYSLKQAKGLLDKVLVDQRFDKFSGILVSSYQNGREQGYSLSYKDINTNKTVVISFGQQRNSDDLIVYHGSPNDVCISEDAYRNGKYFGYRHFNATTNYIYELLEGNAKKTSIGDPFVFHNGLKVAEELLGLLFKDERSKLYSVMVEGLQMKEINGYSIQIYNQSYDLKTVGITANEEGELTLHFGKAIFQGIHDVTEIISYKDHEKQNAVNKIYGVIEEANKAKV